MCVPQIYLHTKGPVLLKMERPHLIFETEVSRIVLIDNVRVKIFLTNQRLIDVAEKADNIGEE